MNLKIKFREASAPFAPGVLREKVADYFDLDTVSPYVLLVAPVKDGEACAFRQGTGTVGHRPTVVIARSDPVSGGDACRPIRRAMPDHHRDQRRLPRPDRGFEDLGLQH